MRVFVHWFHRLHSIRLSWQQRREERAAWKWDVQIARERARRNLERELVVHTPTALERYRTTCVPPMLSSSREERAKPAIIVGFPV